MTSPLLALFTRSLREDAHSKATYATKIGVGIFILLILLSTALTGRWVGAPGRNFFTGIVILQIIAITLIGLSYFASAVTEEKEEETLGLLRMTNLNPLSILLGKSTSRFCGALLLLVAQFPFTVIAITLGGVSLGQIAATYCTLAAYTFLLCNIALLGSVLARRTPGAAAFSVLGIALFLSAGPLLRLLHAQFLKAGVSSGLDRAGAALWQTTPIARLSEVLGTGFSGTPAGWQVASNLALGAGCFLVAWLVFDGCCDRTSAEAVASGPVPRPSVGVRLGRPPRPSANALVWKDYHFLHGGRMGLIVRSLGYGGAFLFVFSKWQPFVTGAVVGTQSIFLSIITFVFTIDVAAMAGRMFRHEIRDQTLSALAILPCTIRQLAYRKVRACLIAAAPGVLCLVVGGILMLTSMGGSNDMGQTRMMVFAQTLGTWVNIALMVHVVAWLSLFMKRGALPVGYVATNAFNILISMLGLGAIAALTFSGSGRAFAANPMSYMVVSQLVALVGNLVAALVLHRVILRRLEGIAGEC